MLTLSSLSRLIKCHEGPVDPVALCVGNLAVCFSAALSPRCQNTSESSACHSSFPRGISLLSPSSFSLHLDVFYASSLQPLEKSSPVNFAQPKPNATQPIPPKLQIDPKFEIHTTQSPEVKQERLDKGPVISEDALNNLRRELEIERIEVDKWKKDQQREIAEQQQRIQEAQHSLLEEKIR